MAIQRKQAFTGHLALFDHSQRVTLSAGVHIWTSRNEAGFELNDGHGGSPHRIVFEQRQVRWAFGVICKAMRAHAYRVTGVQAIPKPLREASPLSTCPECLGVGEAEVRGRLVTCPRCKGQGKIEA